MSKGLILVVDDEENILSSLEGILHDDGYDVMTVEEGETALNIIASDQPDLVLLDIWLPGMDGIEVLKSAKKTGVDAEFIMMSGHGSIDTAVQATKLGAFDFVEKPLSLDVVLLMVKMAMKRKIVNRKDDSKSDLSNINEDSFLGVSSEAKKIREQLKSLQGGNHHIIISGEKGTGKTLIASILSSSPGLEVPSVKIDCASIPRKKTDRILFGSGSKKSAKPGKFHIARNGILVLDGLDLLSKDIQENILKNLRKEKSNGKQKKGPCSKMQVIAVISDVLEKRVEEGVLSEGLLEFLAPETISVPPLKKRCKDIEMLANFFLSENRQGSKENPLILEKSAVEAMRRYSWSGNVKELKDVLANIPDTEVSRQSISFNDLPPPIRNDSRRYFQKPFNNNLTLKEEEFLWDRESILYHLKKNGWDIKKAARNMRLSVDRLENKLARHGLDLKSLKARRYSTQKTLKRSVVVCGQGLHSGIKTGLILSPLPPNSGIVFCDISSGETVRAHLNHVNSMEYATGLRKGKQIVRTTEHIMAALHMYRINNLLIKMGDEVPIMDGSASDFCDLIEDGGIEEQDVFCEELVIDKTYTIGSLNNGKSISIEPSEIFTVHYTLDYPTPIGNQEFLFGFKGKNHFKEEIAPARTFGFLKDYEKLEALGLASGGRLNNLILLDDNKVINTKLRFPDEFVRHKILDIIGDFYLLGMPVKGKIIAKMTGHKENISLLQKVKDKHPSFCENKLKSVL